MPHFCCATPSRDFSLTFTCSGNGIHTAQLLQGHSNQVVDPYSTHHPLTYDEAMCLGWIFHVTDSANVPSIRRSGLMTDAKGSGRGGRDALHFMYHNDNGQGYIRMAEGTTPPRQYRQPAYFVLDPKFIESQQLFLTKTGVVLFFGDIPAELLRLQDQLPTMACNVLRPGRGHMLPPSVTGGTWPADVSYGHVRHEKGVGFAPGGPLPETIRTTAWQFMGQEIPQNYGKLVFGFPLTSEVDFDPALELVHGLLAESSHQRQESAKDDQPMQNHMNSHQDVQDALCRERNLTVNGNNSLPHQEVQGLQKKNLHMMISQSKKQHRHMNKLILHKMIPWMKR